MKKNDYLLLTAVTAYSVLFNDQNAGFNFLLFSLLILILLLIKEKNLINNSKWCWAAAMVLISSVCIVVHSSALSIIANIVSLMLVAAFSFNSKTSSIFSFLFSIYSLVSSGVFMILDAIKRSQENKQSAGSDKNYKWLGIAGVTVISILFFTLYKNSNPLFAEYTKWINLDFISISWFFFTLGGFFLMYGFLYHRNIPMIERWENALKTKIEFITIDQNGQKRLDAEKASVITLFVLLNIMLLTINFGDFNTLIMGGSLPKGIKHSDFVHSGVGALILSIILAIGIIMYFLRGSLNFIKGNKFIKVLILVWILQNVMMLFSTCYRNHLYVSEYTLTYKRIGVYVWLGLALIGLLITALKIHFNKSNWYLIKTNVAIWFTVLTLSSAADWDLLITRYNLQHKNINEIDYEYLFSMSDTNLPEMIEFCHKKAKLEKGPIKLTPNSDREYYYSSLPYLNLLRYKIEHYLRDYKNDPRSWDMRDERISNYLKLKYYESKF